VPVLFTHSPNINAIENVNNIGAMPTKKLDNNIVNINMLIVFILLANVQLVILEYMFDLISCDGFFGVFVFNKYPGVHSMPNPNGQLNNIFHAGILNCCMRQILT
jgi:hypothetical protein